jgi:hypothetical protein
MKRFFGLSFVLFFLFAITGQLSLSSCTKESTKYDTVVKQTNVYDTINRRDTINMAILTANSWKIEEIRAVSGNNVIFYQRGGNSNTQNFDNEYITFNSDGSGTYVDNLGGTYTINWKFADSTYTVIKYTLNLPTPLFDTWENIIYRNGSIMYDEYNNQNGTNNQSTVIRIPK